MQGRALGKGLSALIPEKAEEESSSSVAHLKIQEIRENRLQPRSHYDDAKQAELMSSIKEKGVLQPILVRRQADHYEVIAGERRFRAARALKMQEVPVIIKEATDQEALVLALIENIQREELNPIEEAKAFKRLVEDFQFSQDNVAQSVGKDRSTISNLLRLLKLPEEIQVHVSDGLLSMGQARALLSVEDGLLQKDLCAHILKNGLSVRETENLVRTGLKPSVRQAKIKNPKGQEPVNQLEEQLQKLLGTKVRILAGKKRGKIVIEYFSLDELKRILGFFKK